MATIRLIHAKLHQVTVTEAKRDYVGSITIDSELLEQVGILPLEEVEIVNVSNGNRWSTYALPGEVGTGCICANGGGALLCQPGDILIIFSYEWCDRTDVLRRGHTARVIVADEQNRCKEFFHQTLTPCDNKLLFDPSQALTVKSDSKSASFDWKNCFKQSIEESERIELATQE
jgi:aspartate 1-decarboxylase